MTRRVVTEIKDKPTPNIIAGITRTFCELTLN